MFVDGSSVPAPVLYSRTCASSSQARRVCFHSWSFSAPSARTNCKNKTTTQNIPHISSVWLPRHVLTRFSLRELFVEGTCSTVQGRSQEDDHRRVPLNPSIKKLTCDASAVAIRKPRRTRDIFDDLGALPWSPQSMLAKFPTPWPWLRRRALALSLGTPPSDIVRLFVVSKMPEGSGRLAEHVPICRMSVHLCRSGSRAGWCLGRTGFCSFGAPRLFCSSGIANSRSLNLGCVGRAARGLTCTWPDQLCSFCSKGTNRTTRHSDHLLSACVHVLEEAEYLE